MGHTRRTQGHLCTLSLKIYVTFDQVIMHVWLSYLLTLSILEGHGEANGGFYNLHAKLMGESN